jgi:hypothetical protein
METVGPLAHSQVPAPVSILSHIKPAKQFSPLNAKLNPTCLLLALFEDHHILHVSR